MLSKILHVLEWILAVFGLLMVLYAFSLGSVSGAILFVLSAFLISPLAEIIPAFKNKGIKAFLIQAVVSFALLLHSWKEDFK